MSINKLVSFFLKVDPLVIACLIALAICLAISGIFNIWAGIITAIVAFIVFLVVAFFVLARFTPEDITHNYDPLR